MPKESDSLIGFIIAIVIASILGFGIWKMRLSMDWGMKYEKQVKAMIAPLEARIDSLEIEVERLKNGPR